MSMRILVKENAPFTTLAEVQDTLFWNSLCDVFLCTQTCNTHVAWVWLDWGSTVTTQAKIKVDSRALNPKYFHIYTFKML